MLAKVTQYQCYKTWSNIIPLGHKPFGYHKSFAMTGDYTE